MGEFERRLGERLKGYREAEGLTQKEVAQTLGVSDKLVSKWEKGQVSPNTTYLRAACSIFHCTPNELILGETTEWNGGIKAENSGSGYAVKLPSDLKTQYDREIADRRELMNRVIRKQLSLTETLDDPEYAGYSKSALRDTLALALIARVARLIDVKEDKILAERILRCYPSLRQCFVAQVVPSFSAIIRTEAVAFLAVEKLISYMAKVSEIGLSGGTTIARFLELIPPGLPALNRTHWIPLLAPSRKVQVETSLSANQVVSRIVYGQLDSVAHYLHYLSTSERDVSTGLSEDTEYVDHARHLLARAKSVPMAIISVGSPEFGYRSSSTFLGYSPLKTIFDKLSDAEKHNCVGDILLTLVDKDGYPIGDEITRAENDNIVYSIGLEGLKGIVHNEGMVWILAARPKKAGVIHAALLQKYVNGLVLDTSTANQLLKLSSG